MNRGILSLGVLLLGFSSAGAQVTEVDPDPKGVASGVSGQVWVLEPEASSPKALADSDPVFEGSRITSGEGAFVEIDLIDGSELKIDEMTQVDLSNVDAQPESLERMVDLSMLYGTLRVSVQNGFSDRSVFKVVTPVSVAGVRGTDFAVEYESEDESQVDVFDGEVVVGQEGAKETVESGESSRVGRGKGITKERLKEDRHERWEHFKESMHDHRQERAESVLREKIERVRAENPNDPRLAGLENALQNVSKDRTEARSKLEARREKMKDRREERRGRMREFAQKHGRERFEEARKFRGGAMTPEERKAAQEKMGERRRQAREKAVEQHQKRREKIKDRREEKKDQKQEGLKDRRENRQDQMKDRRDQRRDKMQDKREQRKDTRQKHRR